MSSDASNPGHEGFAADFQAWFFTETPRDAAVQAGLKERYRAAWADGAKDDRIAVISFVYLTEDIEGFDLILAGLQDAEPAVAQSAVSNALALLTFHYDLGPGAREALEAFGREHPGWRGLSEAALTRVPPEGRS